MRCPRCGNENPDQNRFCGMCGATLLAPPEASASHPPRAAASAATPVPAKETPPAPRAQVSEPPRPTPVTNDVPSISGPSFLGLNDPAPRKRPNLSIDANSGTSRNLDYLLEDDEEHHKSSGGGKFFLFVIALALAVGLGYLRWRNHGPGWLGLTTKPPAATEPTTDANSSPAPDSQPSANQPPAATAQPPAVTASSNPSPATTPPPTSTPAATSPGDAPASAPSPSDSDKASKTTAPENLDKPAPASAKDSTPLKQPSPADSTTASDAPDQTMPTPAQPKPAPAKPPAPVDPVAEAQKYLYGRGVTQDCARGMRYLKPAANQGNSKAMVEMGALYSAGLCTPHDLPTAYRWFAMALRKDPDNQDVQSDLQKLWGEMTQPERQLAIKLTQ